MEFSSCSLIVDSTYRIENGFQTGSLVERLSTGSLVFLIGQLSTKLMAKVYYCRKYSLYQGLSVLCPLDVRNTEHCRAEFLVVAISQLLASDSSYYELISDCQSNLLLQHLSFSSAIVKLFALFHDLNCFQGRVSYGIIL